MSERQLAAYYWNVRALIAEQYDIFAPDNARWAISSEDEAVYQERINADLPYQDGSILYARCNLRAESMVIEWRYAYIYFSPEGERIVQYDNREHHPEIPTHPHHMHTGPTPTHSGEDIAQPPDIHPVSFETVLRKIRKDFFDKQAEA